MKSKSLIKALVVSAVSVVWFYGFARLYGRNVSSFPSEEVEMTLSLLVLSVPLLLPYLGFRVVRMQPRSSSYKLVLFPTFVISLAPAVVLLSLILFLLLAPAPR